MCILYNSLCNLKIKCDKLTSRINCCRKIVNDIVILDSRNCYRCSANRETLTSVKCLHKLTSEETLRILPSLCLVVAINDICLLKVLLNNRCSCNLCLDDIIRCKLESLLYKYREINSLNRKKVTNSCRLNKEIINTVVKHIRYLAITISVCTILHRIMLHLSTLSHQLTKQLIFKASKNSLIIDYSIYISQKIYILTKKILISLCKNMIKGVSIYAITECTNSFSLFEIFRRFR